MSSSEAGQKGHISTPSVSCPWRQALVLVFPCRRTQKRVRTLIRTKLSQLMSEKGAAQPVPIIILYVAPERKDPSTPQRGGESHGLC